jgi:hypothetical protein
MKPSVVVAAGIFTALLITDLIKKDYNLIVGHVLFAVLGTIGIFSLAEMGSEWTAWILIALPFILLFIAHAIRLQKERGDPVPSGTATLVPPAPTLGPGGTPPTLGPGGTPPTAGATRA